MRLEGHVVCIKVCEIRAEFRQKIPHGLRRICRPRYGLNVNIIINCKALGGPVWILFSRLTIGAVMSYCQYGNEPLDSM